MRHPLLFGLLLLTFSEAAPTQDVGGGFVLPAGVKLDRQLDPEIVESIERLTGTKPSGGTEILQQIWRMPTVTKGGYADGWNEDGSQSYARIPLVRMALGSKMQISQLREVPMIPYIEIRGSLYNGAASMQRELVIPALHEPDGRPQRFAYAQIWVDGVLRGREAAFVDNALVRGYSLGLEDGVDAYAGANSVSFRFVSIRPDGSIDTSGLRADVDLVELRRNEHAIATKMKSAASEWAAGKKVAASECEDGQCG